MFTTSAEANRSDKPGQLMGGSKRDYIEDIGDYIINNYFKYDENYDFGDAFNETIDSYEVYYNKQWKVVYDLGYYDWSDNDLGIHTYRCGSSNVLVRSTSCTAMLNLMLRITNNGRSTNYLDRRWRFFRYRLGA
jgi:phosphomevalonate kinase